MRVLHTADWHLGQRLAGYDRAEEHALFLKWLLQTIQEQDVQLLLVAGDIFDSAHPPQATMQLYYDFLKNLSALERCSAVIIGGNHDSPAHLNAPSGLLKRFQIHVIGSPSADRDDDVIKITPGIDLLDSVCVCAVPYLRDRDVLQVVVGEATGAREDRLREGVYQYYHDMRRRAQVYHERGIPIIATGHLTLQARTNADSGVPDDGLHIGTLGSLEGSRFPQDFAYVALGHLHAPHASGDCESMRYSGSPFPMSFSESEQEKSVTLLDFGESRLRHLEPLPIPSFRKLHRFGGTLADLERWIPGILPESEADLPPWIEVHLTDECQNTALSDKVTELVQERPVEVLKVMSALEEPASRVWHSSEVSLQDYAPAEVFAERCHSAGLDPDDEATRRCRDTFAELLSLHEARSLELVE